MMELAIFKTVCPNALAMKSAEMRPLAKWNADLNHVKSH
jgi:hypothetical protein